ncbi:MAG: hypothetical protein LW630_10560 [Saprospiraceae bacterium]|jgi:hypothetical protein|nr:hypothetical protein [Saprospiraceae bacterium]
MGRIQKWTWFFLLVIFSLCEMWMWGTHHNRYDIYYSPLVFFLASLCVSIIALVASGYLAESQHHGPVFQKKSLWALLFLPGLFWLIQLGYQAFAAHPIDYNDSDIFAQVLAPARWVLSGQYAYQDVELPTYTMHNTYLPMQWLPFIAPVYFRFDPRWVPLLAWSIAILFFISASLSGFQWRRWFHWLAWILAGYLSVRTMYEFIQFHSFDYTVSLEMLPAAYYILFILACLRGSWWAMGITLSFCLMSRFSIILLIPFLGYYVWKRYGFSVLSKSVLVLVSSITLLFVIPFMTKDPSLPLKIIGNYDSGAANEWQTHGWQEPGAEPHQLARGFGLAIFVKKFYEYDIKDGIHHLKQGSVALCLLTAFFLVYLYWRNQKHLNRDWLFLGGLKLYLSFFYAFVLIPYPYLFALPLTVTAILLVKAATDVTSDAGWQSGPGNE